jgi:hypothetical protein
MSTRSRLHEPEIRIAIDRHLRRALGALPSPRGRCLACGGPIRPWDTTVKLRRDLAHDRCALYQVPRPRGQHFPADRR